MLKKVVSGGQTGADISALIVAKKYGLETGGWIPKGFRTQVGPKPIYAELYGLVEHESSSYVPRTYANVKDSDGTLRIAGDLFSAGEIQTLKAIKQYDKPYMDIDVLQGHSWKDLAVRVRLWIEEYNIQILNVAGNSEKTFPGISGETIDFMEALFKELDFCNGV